MAYTAYSQAWLEDGQSIRSIFIVATPLYDSSGLGVSYTATPQYFSSDVCTTTDGLINFKPIIFDTDITLTEAITSDGSTSMSFSDIGLMNFDGSLDSYLDSNTYVWSNQQIQIYLGDVSWSLLSTDFTIATSKLRLVFNGVMDDIDSKSRDSVNIKIRDKMERLNAPVTQNKFGTATGTWANAAQIADIIKPLVFGEVFNMTPTLVDPNNGGGQYMVNDGAVSDIMEIRDNGIPIYQSGSTAYTGASVDNSTGLFILQYPPQGDITVSLKGINNSINLATGALVTSSYQPTIANLIALIVTQYGKANTRLTASDLDLVNLAAFDAANTAPVGLIVTDTTNVLTICQELASSLGAQIVFTREGKLQILRFGVGMTAAQDPRITIGNTTASPVSPADMVFDSISISNKFPVIGAIKLGYCKNWTVQEGLLTALPSDHKDLFATEWMTTTSTASTTIVSNYNLETDPDQIDTMLLTTTDASTEATRRLNFYDSQTRYIYKFSGTPKLFGLCLGQQVYLTHDRFNLYAGGNGKLGQVVSLSPNWTSFNIDVEVLV